MVLNSLIQLVSIAVVATIAFFLFVFRDESSLYREKNEDRIKDFADKVNSNDSIISDNQNAIKDDLTSLKEESDKNISELSNLQKTQLEILEIQDKNESIFGEMNKKFGEITDVNGEEVLTFKNNNVGIASSNPTQKLHINGKLRLNGRILATKDGAMYICNGQSKNCNKIAVGNQNLDLS